mgnify:CR=1 FL=1
MAVTKLPRHPVILAGKYGALGIKSRLDCYPLTLRKKSKLKITIQTTVATAHAMPEIAPKRSRIGLQHNTKRAGE